MNYIEECKSKVCYINSFYIEYFDQNKDRIMLCPHTSVPLENPVFTPSGHTVDRKYLEDWKNSEYGGTCPFSRVPIVSIQTNYHAKALYESTSEFFERVKEANNKDKKENMENKQIIDDFWKEKDYLIKKTVDIDYSDIVLNNNPMAFRKTLKKNSAFFDNNAQQQTKSKYKPLNFHPEERMEWYN